MTNVKCRNFNDKKISKILEYLLYLLVFLLPWQMRWIIWDPQLGGQVWEYGRIAIYGFDVVFIILFALTLLTTRDGPAGYFVNWKLETRNEKLGIVFMFLCFYVFMSTLWAADKLLTFYSSLRILQGVLLVWLISKIKFSRIKMGVAFVASVTLSAILGIYQFLTQTALSSKWLGLAYHSAQILGDAVVETASGRWLRAYGSLPHPNILAGFIVLALLVLIYLILNRQNRRKEINLLVVSCCLLVIALFFTFSRAGWLGLSVVILLSCYLFIKNKLERFFIIKLLIVISCLLFILSICYWPLVTTRLGVGESERLEIKSNIERVTGYREAGEIMAANLWWGLGVGNYTVALQELLPGQPAWAYQPVHNVFVLAAVELGILGVIVILLSGYFVSLKLEIRKRKSGIVFMFLCFYVFMFMFDHFWWTLSSALLLIFLGIGLLLKKE